MNGAVGITGSLSTLTEAHVTHLTADPLGGALVSGLCALWKRRVSLYVRHSGGFRDLSSGGLVAFHREGSRASGDLRLPKRRPIALERRG